MIEIESIKLEGRDMPLSAIDWRNDENVWRWCRQNHIITERQQEKWEDDIESDPTVQMLVIVNDIGSALGVCGLTSINYHHRTAEFSLYIAPEYQGKGFGKTALIKLLDYGFNRLNLYCIWGEVMENNPALKMFEDLGFTIGGKLRSRYFKDRHYVDSYAIDILAEEFNERY